MKKYHSQRGAILVESALVVGAIFLMLFGTVYLAIIGFDQMSADGASFQVAHQTAVGASAPPSATHGMFPNIPQSQITTVPLPAPSASVPVNYGYNDPDSTLQAGSVNDRHGGVSMVQAEQVQGQVTKLSANILGQPISVVGNMIEPLWVENGLHFNALNANTYGGLGTVCAPNVVPSGTPSTPPPCFQGDPLTQGENTPPYYIGFNLMQHCTQAMPFAWATNTQCSATQFTPLGVSEFLDYNNWCSPTGGLPCSVPAGAAGSAQSSGTFATASCHQRVYAALAAFFQLNPDLYVLYTTKLGGFGVEGASVGPYYYYGFRNNSWRTPNGYTALPNAQNTPSATFKDFAGFGSTYAAEQNYQKSGDSSGLADIDQDVQEVYHWDGADVQGTPPPGSPNDPLYPSSGC